MRRRRPAQPEPYQSLKTKQVDETVVFNVCAMSEQDVDASLEKLNKFIIENIKKENIDHEHAHEALENDWSNVVNLAKKHDVDIHCQSSSTVVIEGMKTNVSDCYCTLLQLIMSYAEQERKKEVSLPEHWDLQPPAKVVHLVPLQASSREYHHVLSIFNMNKGVCKNVEKIERVQNPGLYKAFLAKKQSMDGENEKQLFHGTKGVNIVSINTNNFNRSYAGINGTMYGDGVYFARDASYSMRYCPADRKGYSYMYVARVLVGKFTAGQRKIKAPPSRNDSRNPGMLYDSVVDNADNPSIFVIFLDPQCYPEYLITFRKCLESTT